MGFDPLSLRKRGNDANQGLAREDDCSLGNCVDVALESRGGHLIHDLRGDSAKCGPTADLGKLLGVKRQSKQVANGLFEASEDKECPALRHLADEQLERRAVRLCPRRDSRPSS